MDCTILPILMTAGFCFEVKPDEVDAGYARSLSGRLTI